MLWSGIDIMETIQIVLDKRLLQATDRRRVLGVDYDPEKIRVAGRTAPDHPRLRFEVQNILDWDYPSCDTVLLLDVLHYWRPEKQASILGKVRRALRPAISAGLEGQGVM